MNFYLVAIVMFALSLTVGEIFAKQDKYRNSDLENEDQGREVEERNLHYSTRNARSGNRSPA